VRSDRVFKCFSEELHYSSLYSNIIDKPRFHIHTSNTISLEELTEVFLREGNERDMELVNQLQILLSLYRNKI